ncbi:MAG: ATP-binding cassette domain-containing protein, partial [Lentisphaeria bacterium]|nr:ATP-binding cassette domain-containing protein [Lentisphaeria bacterium]
MLSCRDLKVWFPIRSGIFNRVVGHVRAVDGVSLEIPRGQTLGLVGESGCGKTTLGRALIGLETPTGGCVELDGTPVANLKGDAKRKARRNLQMIFQDPFASLDPRMSVMELVTEGLETYGLYKEGESREEAAARLMREVGLEPEGMFRYPHEFSGGQRQRISIARAISLEPDYIVCDEPVSALDVSVQAQVIRLLAELREKHSLSYLFISHDLSVVRLIAQKVAVMYLGHIVEFGNARDVLTAPMHPYSQALVSAIPVPGKSDRTNRIILKGELPSPS